MYLHFKSAVVIVLLEVLLWLSSPSAVPPILLLKTWCMIAKIRPGISNTSATAAVRYGSPTASHPRTTRKSLRCLCLVLNVMLAHALWALASTLFSTIKTSRLLYEPRMKGQTACYQQVLHASY